MISLLVAPLLCAASLAPPLHVPHDDVHDLAIAPLAGGGQEIVMVSNEFSKVMRSLDGGLSWEPISGDGLDRTRASRIEFWPHPTEPRFLIGTDLGVWSYFPLTGEVRRVSDGLTGANGFITEISAPRNGAEAVVLSTKKGDVFGWNETTQRWSRILHTGNEDGACQVAVVPFYDPLAGPGPAQTILAGVAGQLYVSEDAGATWSLHPQFSVAATASTDWSITALAFDVDYATSGVVLVGRGRDNVALPSGDEGEIWQSADFGGTFALAQTFGSIVRNIEATPAGPGGQRHFFAGVYAYPDRADPANGIGVQRSDDLGLTWDDFGNEQDFFGEPVDTTVVEAFRVFQGFAASTDFANDGVIYYGRAENMYVSRDAGVHWRRVRTRPNNQIRGMQLTTDANGDILAFGGAKGSSMLKGNVTTGALEVLDKTKLNFEEPLSVSPNFASDGAVLAVGQQGVAYWFDPSKPANNLFGQTGWLFAKRNTLGFIQNSAISPHFHANPAEPNTDRTALWSRRLEGASFSPKTWRTLDGGLTIEEINTIIGGGTAPFFRQLIVAPTYDDSTPSGRTDIYAAPNNQALFRLEDTEWELIHQFPSRIQSIALDPTFDRPGNPRLFVALDGGPFLATLTDHDTGPVEVLYVTTGMESQITSIEVHPDFTNTSLVYVSTWGDGVLKADLSQPIPSWEPVGTGYPSLWTNFVRLSPDFLNDNTLVAGGQDGFFVGQDAPGVAWTPLGSSSTIDNTDPSFMYYQPNEPANLQPDRPWPWMPVDIQTASQFGLTLRGPAAHLATTDGAYVEWEGYGRSFTMRTFEGNKMGTVTVTAFDLATGASLASTTVDLNTGGALADADVNVTLATRTAVRLRIEAQIDPGENFVFDAVGLEQ